MMNGCAGRLGKKGSLRHKAFQPWLMGGLEYTEGVPSPSEEKERS